MALKFKSRIRREIFLLFLFLIVFVNIRINFKRPQKIPVHESEFEYVKNLYLKNLPRTDEECEIYGNWTSIDGLIFFKKRSLFLFP